MSRESEFAAVLTADATLMATLTGGVYTLESVGLAGITRETQPAAFDTSGYLKPCALVRARDLVPDGAARDLIARVASASQVVEIWLYADSGAGYSAIEAAKVRLYTLLEGRQVGSSFDVQWVNSLGNLRDLGSLKNSCMSRIDFIVYEIHS